MHRGAAEAADQHERGWILLGGGYGYFDIDGREYLVENRSSVGYQLLANNTGPKYLTSNQRRLLEFSRLSVKALRKYLNQNYIGIISGRSPNDIGAEFCVYDMFTERTVGKVIVGGTAARNDFIYYGPSVNDRYGHERLGVRILQGGEFDYYWIADLSDSVNDKLTPYADKPVRLIGLLEPEYCDAKKLVRNSH